MKNEVGLWIDHRQAVIVSNLDQQEEIKRISSDGASHTGGENGPHSDTTSEDRIDRREGEQLDRFYDEVIAELKDATSILIIGPGEAKGELQKRLESHAHSTATITVESADKLTDPQIAAEVRKHFGEAQHS
jgi:stalled ribosome rescue protein Dom34